jgi:hypothetical protein
MQIFRAHPECAETLHNALSSIQPMARELLSRVRSIELDAHAESKEVIGASAAISVQSLAILVADVRRITELAIDRFWTDEAKRLGLPEEVSEETALQQASRPRPFCYGAKLVQSGRPHHDLESPLSADWGTICKFCNHEIGSYQSIRLNSDSECRENAATPSYDNVLSGKVIETSSLLAASHLIACRSFQDRKAFYRCLPCYQRGIPIDLPSAMVYEKHMRMHPNFILQQDRGDMDSTIVRGMHRFLATTTIDSHGIVWNFVNQQDRLIKEVEQSQQGAGSDHRDFEDRNEDSNSSDEHTQSVSNNDHHPPRHRSVANPAVQEIKKDGTFEETRDLPVFHTPIQNLVSGGHSMREPDTSRPRFDGHPILRHSAASLSKESISFAEELHAKLPGPAQDRIDIDDPEPSTHQRPSSFRIARRPISDSIVPTSRIANLESSPASRDRLRTNTPFRNRGSSPPPPSRSAPVPPIPHRIPDIFAQGVQRTD